MYKDNQYIDTELRNLSELFNEELLLVELLLW